jgi:hypothetical protein
LGNHHPSLTTTQHFKICDNQVEAEEDAEAEIVTYPLLSEGEGVVETQLDQDWEGEQPPLVVADSIETRSSR